MSIPSMYALIVSFGEENTILFPCTVPERSLYEKLYTSSCESFVLPSTLAVRSPVAWIPRSSGKNLTSESNVAAMSAFTLKNGSSFRMSGVLPETDASSPSAITVALVRSTMMRSSSSLARFASRVNFMSVSRPSYLRYDSGTLSAAEKEGSLPVRWS